MMNEKRIGITIGTKGEVMLQAKEGFSGTSCVEATRNLEIAIGGQEVADGKTSAYYDGDNDSPVTIEGM